MATPKSNAAKSRSPIEKLFDSAACVKCGHPFDAHPGYPAAGPCPDLPPAKSQVTVDEAVAAKGGKPGFLAQLAEATGAAAANRRQEEASEHFDRRTTAPTRANIPIARLRPMGGNPRGELGDVSALVKSIEANGFIGALSVREVEPNVFEVWAGNRRLRAAKEAQLEEVPCDIYELTEVQALELNLTEQINRADLTPLEEGEACRRLMELSGYTAAQVGEKLGQSTAWVLKRVALCSVAPEVRKALAKGEVSLTVANALAALPSQQLQAKALEKLDARPDSEKRNATADADVQWLRTTQCRVLSEATWKLTDAELLPEAGACSACPHNSANATMPGLFDNAKAKPTCARVECFADKELAAWLKRTEKQKAAGAKVLSLPECRKLFARGNDLGSASRYFDASEKAPKDKQGRTWGELVEDMPTDARPQLHLAQDNGGKLRQLYVGDKVMEACATVLKLRWAKTVVEEAEESRSATTPEARAKRDAEEAEKKLIAKVRDDVVTSVLGQLAVKLASNFTLDAARFLAARVGERALERFGAALGKKRLPKDWLEKGATTSELLAAVWLADADDDLRAWDGYDERFLATAKAHGIDVEKMTKAQLDTARREAATGQGEES